jgi:hypothetical protein
LTQASCRCDSPRKNACTPVRGATPVLEFFSSANYIVEFIASLIGIGTFLWAARKWDLWARLADWRYRHSPYYRIDQLQEQADALLRRIAEFNEILPQVTGHQSRALDTQEKLAAALLDHKNQLAEANSQIKAQQALIDDLVILTARYWRDTSDRSPQRQRIIETAKGRDVPPLPKLPSA